jgi:hypothetical protein
MRPPVTEFETRRAEVGERLAAFLTDGDAAARDRGAGPRPGWISRLVRPSRMPPTPRATPEPAPQPSSAYRAGGTR